MSLAPHGTELDAAITQALTALPEVRLVYIFGSRASGKMRPNSDLDIAVKFAGQPSEDDRGSLKLQLIDTLTKTLGPLGERVDLLDLDRAPTTIAFRVIVDGRLLLCRDPRERIALEARVARRYDDERPQRELFRRAAHAAAARMGQVKDNG